jgi:Cd2+/Zn2+-exporting ATPase
MKTIELRVPGLCCAEEVAQLESALRKWDGVGNFSANLLTQKLTVAYDPTRISPEKLIDAIQKTGFSAQKFQEPHEIHAEEARNRRIKLVATVISGAFLTLAAALHVTRGIEFGLVLACYAVAIFSGAWFVAPRAWHALARRRAADMNVLMLVAVMGAIFIGQWAEAATVMFLFALAQLIETHSMERARNAIRQLMALSPLQATVKRDKAEHNVPLDDVRIGETVVIRPGERVPLDARITHGASFLDQSPITGESLPVEKKVGDEIFAGSINQGGALEAEVVKIAGDSTLARIIRLVEEAQAARAPTQQFVDTFAKYYTPAVIAMAALIAMVPPLAIGGAFGGVDGWLYRALVLLVVACPCALVISTPVSIVSGLTAAARHGVLIKGGAHLEAAGAISAFVFDKTGTVTEGKPRVERVVTFNHEDETKILAISAAIEARSEHLLGRAIVEFAQNRGISVTPARNFQAISGAGASAEVDGHTFFVGNHRLFEEKNLCPPALHEQLNDLERQGKTAVMLGDARGIRAAILISDQVREDAAPTIAELRALGVEKIVLMTGDNEGTARAIAEKLGVDEFHAELLPQDKVRLLKKLRDDFGAVGMVGDGVNDAPALATATVGFAMGAAGSDVALETADVALMSDDLTKLPYAMRLSRATRKIVQQNIALSLGIKAVFIALAIPGLATLWMAVLADMGASLAVVANGLRLLRFRQNV